MGVWILGLEFDTFAKKYTWKKSFFGVPLSLQGGVSVRKPSKKLQSSFGGGFVIRWMPGWLSGPVEGGRPALRGGTPEILLIQSVPSQKKTQGTSGRLGRAGRGKTRGATTNTIGGGDR